MRKLMLFVCMAIMAFNAVGQDMYNSSEVSPGLLASFNSIDQTKSTQNVTSSSDLLSRGIYLRFGIVKPTDKYLSTESYPGSDKYLGYNFQFGSYFYFGPTIADKLRFGLDATFLDFTYMTNSDADDFKGFNLSLEVGPLVSFSPIDMIAIDVYGKLSPSLFTTYEKVLGEEYFTVGYGLNTKVGIGFRFKVLNVGYERHMGKSDFTDQDSNKINDLNIASNRFFIGVKF